MPVLWLVIVTDGVAMSNYPDVGMTARERFMQSAQEEMSAFERRELDFLRKDRQERAEQFRFPPDDEHPS